MNRIFVSLVLLLLGQAPVLGAVSFMDYQPPGLEAGRIWFPDEDHGRNTLVLIAHGNGFTANDYQFLVSPLLREGLAVACVGAQEDSEIAERAQGVISHLDYLFYSYPDRLDGRVVLLGHSRGGEAVIRVANQLVGSAYQIAGVISMAPSNLEPPRALDPRATRYLLVLYGSHDSDITGFFPENLPMESPFAAYEAAFPDAKTTHHKALIFIHGGSHSGFSDYTDPENFPDGGAAAYLTTDAQRHLASSFVRLFVRWAVFGNAKAGYHVRGGFIPSEFSIGPGGSDLQKARYSSLYEGGLVARIDDFEDKEKLRNARGDRILTGGGCQIAQDQHFVLDPYSPHLGKGLLVRWSTIPGFEPAKVTFLTHAFADEFRKADHLVFTVGQRYKDPNNAIDLPQDFHVRLMSAGKVATVRLSDWTIIDYPTLNIEDEPDQEDFTKAAMCTVQIPIEAFEDMAGERIQQIEFIFDIPRLDGKYSGALIFDNLGLARFDAR